MFESMPKIGRALGKVWGEFLAAMNEAQKPIQEAAKDVRDALSEPPLLVFVSSVMDPKCEDLKPERAAAKKAIEAFPPLARAWRFEDSPSSPESAGYVYLKKVEQCDIFVLVLGKEITRPVIREYWRARKNKTPRLVFLKKCERTVAALKFVEIIRGEVKYAEFNVADELNRQIWQAVGALLVDGVRQYKLSANDIVILTAFLNKFLKFDLFQNTEAESFPELPRFAILHKSMKLFIGIEKIEYNSPPGSGPTLYFRGDVRCPDFWYYELKAAVNGNEFSKTIRKVPEIPSDGILGVWDIGSQQGQFMVSLYVATLSKGGDQEIIGFSYHV